MRGYETRGEYEIVSDYYWNDDIHFFNLPLQELYILYMMYHSMYLIQGYFQVLSYHRYTATVLNLELSFETQSSSIIIPFNYLFGRNNKKYKHWIVKWENTRFYLVILFHTQEETTTVTKQQKIKLHHVSTKLSATFYWFREHFAIHLEAALLMASRYAPIPATCMALYHTFWEIFFDKFHAEIAGNLFWVSWYSKVFLGVHALRILSCYKDT